MTTWNTIDPNQLVPSVLTSAASTLGNVIEAALSSAAGALSLPSLPSLPSAPSGPEVTAAVVNAILNTLKSVLAGGQVHTIVIPISKTVSQAPAPALPPTLDDLQTALNVVLAPTVADATATNAYASLVAQTGGNAGFYNAFATSLMDPADPNRPQYDGQTDAVVMAVLLVGAARFAAITGAASVLDQLTEPKGGSGDAASRTIPTPQNVQARVVGSSANASVGVQLDWDVPQAAYASPYFASVSITVNRYAVIRTTDPKAASARNVLDLFSTQSLTIGLTSGLSTVVAIGTGSDSAYMDASVTLDPKVPVYYCVAWETTLNELGTPSTLMFDKVSNVTKVQAPAPQPAQTGTAQGWSAVGSAIDVFPPVARAAQALIEQTRGLAAPSASSTSRLSSAMQLATVATQRVSARAVSLLAEVTQLATALSRPIPSMYVTQMSSTTGGNTYLLSQLAARLGDTTDPSRPPFDNGEYVCGVCFVAGAPRIADLAPVIAFFEALFGPAAPANPLLGLLTAIDTAVTAAEAAVFGPNMQPLPAGTSTDPAVPGSINPTTGVAYTPTTPVIADDGTPVAADDPANPNAGFTNVTPTSELC